MNLNVKQKIIIFLGILLIIISFLISPCYINLGDEQTPVGYKPLGIFKVKGTTREINNRIFLHTPTFYAQLISIVLATIGFVIIFHKKKNEG